MRPRQSWNATHGLQEEFSNQQRTAGRSITGQQHGNQLDIGQGM